MPYVSDQQRKFFNSSGAAKAGISPAVVKEFNTSSKGMDLPKFAGNSTGAKPGPPKFRPQPFKRPRRSVYRGDND